jgi:ribulose kinase
MGEMVLAVIDGIITELKDFLGHTESEDKVSRIIATGSSVRKNPLFYEALKRIFNLPIVVSDVEDSAALGGALIGAIATKKLTLDKKNQFVRELLLA